MSGGAGGTSLFGLKKFELGYAFKEEIN